MSADESGPIGLPPLDDRAGPARRISAARAAEMVRAASEAARSAPAAAGAGPTARPSRLRVMLVAAAVLAVGGVASAGVYRWVAAPDPVERPARRGALAPVISDAPPDAGPPSIDASPVELDIELLVEAERDPPPPRSAREPRASLDLLERANERRKAQNWRAADRLYQRVAREHRGTDAAYVATVASASIRLDHLDDPRGALSLYRRALAARRRGALSEEARFGIAAAHRALGDRSREVAALRAFLAAHPRSPLADRARTRLRELAE